MRKESTVCLFPTHAWLKPFFAAPRERDILTWVQILKTGLGASEGGTTIPCPWI